MLVYDQGSDTAIAAIIAFTGRLMRRLKSVIFIGLLMAVAVTLTTYAPSDSKLGAIFRHLTFPGLAVAIVFILSSDANIVTGVIATVLDWAVNTFIYWGMWEILCLGIKKVRPTLKLKAP